MLGRHHLLLSVLTAAIIMLPILIEHSGLFFLVILGVAVGSLMPDADSPDAAIFHEKLRGMKGNIAQFINNLIAPIFPIFGWVTKYAIYKPAVFIFGRTILKKYEIKEQHRGFLHSFIGILTASVLTAIYLIIILLILGYLNWASLLIFMLAYIFGALMHILEDSATVTGTKFNYPFSDTILKGELITRPAFAEKPNIFLGFLSAVFVIFFFTLDHLLIYPVWLITIVSFTFLILSWLIFLLFVAKVRIEHGELKQHPNVKSYF